MDQRTRLIDVATAIADGTPVDWTSVDADVSPRPSRDADRQVLSGLRLLERIALTHANLTEPARASGSFADSTTSPEGAGTTGFPPDGLLTWGPLSIVGKIGSGTFGDVYRARDPRLDRPVALKLLRSPEPDSTHSPTTVIEEARLMARVRHPNVITVHGAERIDGRVGIWMELVEGPTLESELREKGPFDATRLVQIGSDLCGALQAIHRAGLLHGDVKTSNIMRDADGRVVLGDFGAGHEFDPAQELGSGPRNGLTGTPLYLAPEVLEGGTASTRSDIYSLGVVLYRLATGTFPVDGRSVRDVRDAHARHVRIPLSSRRRDLPRPVVDLIERCIDPDSTRRFATVADVQTRLQEAAGHRNAQRPLRHRIVVAAGLAALAIGAFVALRQFTDDARFAGTPAPLSNGVTVRPIQPQRTPPVEQLEPPRVNGAADVTDTASPPLSGVTMRQIQPRWTRPVGQLGPPFGTGAAACIDRNSFNLAVCDLRTGDVRLLTTRGSAEPLRRVIGMAVGPDERLAFVWSEAAPGKAPFGIQEIREIRRDGTGERTVFQPEADARFVRLLQWIPVRDALLVVVANAAGAQRLGVVPLNGSAPTWAKEFDLVAPESLSVSADGRYVAFDMVPEPGNPARDIHVLDLDTRAEWPLVEHPANEMSPVWAPDGRTLVFGSDRLGTMGLWTVATTNGHARSEPMLVRDLGRSVPRLRGFTEDGALSFGVQTGWFDVYVAAIDLDRGTVGQPVRISPRPLDQNAAPDWSFNGDRIAYVSGAFIAGLTPGSTHIVVKERATNSERLLQHQGQIHQTRLRWSPDARLILKGSGAIVSAETGEMIRQLPFEPGTDAIEWSHAGDRIYSIARNRILSTSLASSTTTELHRAVPPDVIDGVAGLAVSPDDRWLTFTTYNPERHCAIHMMPADGGPPRERVRFDQPCSGAAWSPDGSRLVFSVGAQGTLMGPSALWTVDVAAGEPRRLPLTMEQIFQIRLHPNGREILFTSGSPRTEDWLLEGFLENTR